MRKFGALVGIAAALAGNFFAPAYAQDGEGWVVANFVSDIQIRPDGTVVVQELIGADFLGLEKHGIFRRLPYAYYEPDGSTSYTAISVEEVLQDGEPAQYELSRADGHIIVKIGDPDRTVSGGHAYRIRYVVTGALKGFPDYDELYWNATGNDWPVPILRSSARITLPREGFVQASCYAGPRGSSAPCGTNETTTNDAFFAAEEMLAPGGGLTVALGFTKGLVPILSADKFAAAGASPLGTAAMMLTSALTFVAGVFFITRRWWRMGRDRWFKRTPPSRTGTPEVDATEETMPLGAHEAIVAEYDPPSRDATAGEAHPKPLRPAELGVLRDEKADTIDVSATIVDLAVRGYLEITELPKTGMFGKADYELKRLKMDNDELLPYERTLLDGLMNIGNGDGVRVSELKEKFHTKLRVVQNMLYDHMTKEGYFTVNPVSARTHHALFAALLVALGVLGAVWAARTELLFPNILHAAAAGVLTGCLALGLVLFVVALRAMPQRTAKGREVYRKIRGYELYLKSAEQYRQQFHEREGVFMQVLPYVIMFGLTKRLATAMATMGVAPPAPAWYHGVSGQAFTIGAFSESLNSFSNSLGTTMASAPSGSGSGGGGFSGGGGGGGGGGSW
jgi:uncharacterized protein (TIGR04222 family)